MNPPFPGKVVYLMKIVDDDVLDLVAGDRPSGSIDGALRHDDDVQPLTGLASSPVLTRFTNP